MRRAARGVGLIAGTNLLASLSSYVVFVLASRHMDAAALGEFGLIWILAMTLAQLIDGGTGPRLVRDIRQIPDSTWLLRQALVRRCALTLTVAAPVAALLFALGRMSGVDAVLLVLLVLLLTVYGLQVVQRQALGTPGSQARLFLINAVSFSVIAAVSITAIPMTTAALGLGMLAAGFALTTLLALVGHTRSLVLGGGRAVQRPNDARPFFVAVVSNVVTANSSALILGAGAGTVLPAYLIAERPAQGASSLAAGLSGYLLPRMSVADGRTRRRLLRLTLASAPFLLGAAVLATPVVAWLLRELSGRNASLVQTGVVAGLSVAAAVSLLSVPTGTLLTVERQGRSLRDALVLQAILVVTGSMLALWAESAVVAALTVLLARAASFSVQLVALRRPLRKGDGTGGASGGVSPSTGVAPGAVG